MAKRRANGEGNIRKRKDGRWEGRYTAGRDPETGKTIYKNVLGRTRAEVKEKLKKAIEQGSSLDPGKAGQYTVGQWLDTWLEDYAKLSIRPSSHKTYRGFIENHIKPAVGSIPLEKLTSMDLQRLYKKLLESGRVDRIEARNKPKGLSVKTVRNINQMISSACNCAVEQRIIATNPTKGCALPKLEKKEMKILPLDFLDTFFEEARRSGVFELYYIDLSTGLRRGELLGLKWSDIDLNKGIIRVQRQILRQNGAVVEAPLKTKNSYRNIAIGTDAVELLRQMKLQSTSEYVFPSQAGGPISPDSVLHMLQRVLKRAGLEKIPFHALKHTFSVLALQNGVDIKTLSTVFGIDKNNKDGSWYIYLEYEPWPDAQGIQYRKPATYPEIKAWVRHEYGLSVTDHHIAYIKRKHGIIMLVNPRGPLPEDINIPPEKETAIEAALRHFGMI